MNLGGTAFLLTELLFLFFGVSFVIELLQRRIGPERLRSWMGGRPVGAALKGIALGFVTPFCTYSAIPVLVGMRQAAVAPAGYIAFIVAAPVLDPVLFGALAIIVGIKVAVIYLVVAFVAALALALFAQHVGIERHLKPISSLTKTASVSVVASSSPGLAAIDAQHEGSAPGDGCRGGSVTPWRDLGVEARHAARVATHLLRSVGLLLIVGVTVGLVIEALVSPELVADITGSNSTLSIPLAAALGTPLYFHTELFVPIADSLDSAGVSVGTIVALTIAGAGANLPEFVILSRLARARVIAVFFAYVFAVAIVGGLIAQGVAG